MKIIITLVIFSITSSNVYAQSWLDVFNRHRVAHAQNWSAPERIHRDDLRPFVTLSRRNQACSDCRVSDLSDAGRFALAMQGAGTKKSLSKVTDAKGETLLTVRDMDFLQAHAWDGAGKVFIGKTINSQELSPQSLIMALVSQIGVRARPIAVKLKSSKEDSLIWGYRLLPLSAGDIKDAVMREGKLVYPVSLRFNIYYHESQPDLSAPLFDFQEGTDQAYQKITRVGRHTSVATLRAEFTFDQAINIEQNGYRVSGNGRLLNPGSWQMEQAPIDYLWVASPYGSSATEHPALSPKTLNFIESGKWNAPELTKRLTTFVNFERSFEAFPWLLAVDKSTTIDELKGVRILVAKKIEHAFHRKNISVKVWPESISLATKHNEILSLRITFYGNYDQSKVIRIFEEMNLVVNTDDRL